MLQTLEMERYGYPDVHRLVVDAYAAQHPPRRVPRPAPINRVGKTPT